MEVEEAERIVIAKPVPTRPTFASFRSFSELLAGAINSSPTNACSQAAVSAIRPKTVRFKPIVNRAAVGLLSSQAEVSGAAICYPSHEDKVLNSDSKSNVVYKPLAKVVSKTTLHLLANLGNSNISHQQNFPSKLEREKTIESSKMASGIMEDDQKYLPLPNNGDQSSYDGYNWRKYGQKQVKGSDYPRSYYKCTHPNCPVKKKVERSLDGQIAEIVYKGEHNHSKPQPIRRNTLQETNNLSSSNQINDKNEGCEVRTENQNEVGLLGRSTYSSKQLLSYDRLASGVGNIDIRTSENSCGLSGDCEEGSKGLEAKADEPRSKRRKNENEPGISGEGVQELGVMVQSSLDSETKSDGFRWRKYGHKVVKGNPYPRKNENEPGISGEGVQEPGVLVQRSLDSETKGDGFRWRKYGQKVVKGNPYPRSYYRCTNTKCNVRKHVERASEDPKAVITTYEGKHNHDMPVKNTNQAASEPDSQGAISKDKP